MSLPFGKSEDTGLTLGSEFATWVRRGTDTWHSDPTLARACVRW